MRQRLILSAVAYPMINAVLFGCGALLALGLFPADAENVLPGVTVASFVLAAPISLLVAPLMSRHTAREMRLRPVPVRVRR